MGKRRSIRKPEQEGEIDPSRLCGAADFLLHCGAKAEGGEYLVTAWRARRDQLAGSMYTVEELIRGMSFLNRLGFDVIH